VGVAQLIPFRVKETSSDGAKLFSLLFNRRKRDELLFVFSLRARIDQIGALISAGQSQEALSNLEGFLKTAERIPDLPSNAPLIEKLSSFQDRLRGALPNAGGSTQEIPTNAD